MYKTASCTFSALPEESLPQKTILYPFSSFQEFLFYFAILAEFYNEELSNYLSAIFYV